MLIELESNNRENIERLFDFAKQNHIRFSVIDDIDNNYILPGKPLSADELFSLIENSRNSNHINLEAALSSIVQALNGGN